MLSCPDAEWVVKIGPISRTNQAKSREQAEEGARKKVLDAVQEIMDKVRPVTPLLVEGAQCAGGGAPEAKEDFPEVQVYGYALDDRSWFCLATSGVFGVKLVCKK